MPRVARLVQRIHFEDFGGAEFERLVFAYHVRAGWSDVEWYGQTGSDKGRDIVGLEPLTGGCRRTIVQCVNRGKLTQAKAERDLTVAAATGSSRPDRSAIRPRVVRSRARFTDNLVVSRGSVRCKYRRAG